MMMASPPPAPDAPQGSSDSDEEETNDTSKALAAGLASLRTPGEGPMNPWWEDKGGKRKSGSGPVDASSSTSSFFSPTNRYQDSPSGGRRKSSGSGASNTPSNSRANTKENGTSGPSPQVQGRRRMSEPTAESGRLFHEEQGVSRRSPDKEPGIRRRASESNLPLPDFQKAGSGGKGDRRRNQMDLGAKGPGEDEEWWDAPRGEDEGPNGQDSLLNALGLSELPPSLPPLPDFSRRKRSSSSSSRAASDSNWRPQGGAYGRQSKGGPGPQAPPRHPLGRCSTGSCYFSAAQNVWVMCASCESSLGGGGRAARSSDGVPPKVGPSGRRSSSSDLGSRGLSSPGKRYSLV